MLAARPVEAELPAAGLDVPDVCGTIARRTERSEGIPPGLVQAVALAESGRWVAELRRSQPWPWTVTAGPDSYFLPSKQEALRKVRELQASGRTNIDVGCMQVNLGYHGHAFASLADALDPEINVAYGASFLKQLRLETRSWARATARYHSRDPDRGQAYRDKVYRLWHQLRHEAIPAPPRRLAGALIEPRRPTLLPAQRRLIRPATDRDQPPAPGAIQILRGR